MSVSPLKKIDAALPVQFAPVRKNASGKNSYKSRVRVGKFYPQVCDTSGKNAVANDNSASRQTIVWDRVSDPFGNTLSITGPATLNLRGPGQYNDAESGLLYNLMRSIDPRINRGTQSDPIGLLAGINTYAYVGQNPIRWTDFWGLQSLEINQQ